MVKKRKREFIFPLKNRRAAGGAASSLAGDVGVAMTTTGELTQLVRLHYRVLDKDAFIQRLQKLRCMSEDYNNGDWVLAFEREATSYRPPTVPPPEAMPITLGRFRFQPDGSVFFTVRSVERAVFAIKFFAAKISCETIAIDYLVIINRLYTPREILETSDINSWFGSLGCEPICVEDIAKDEMEKIMSMDSQSKRELGLAFFNDIDSRPDPLLEIIRVNDASKDTLSRLDVKFKILQLAAMRRHQGEADYNSGMAVADVCKGMSSRF